MPSALAMAVMTPITGRLVDRFGPRWPAVIGPAIAAYGSLLLAHHTASTPRTELVLMTTIRNVGVGLSMMPSMSAGLSALPSRLLDSGSTMSNVVLRVSSSLGVAGFGGLVSRQHAQLMADRAGLLTAGTGAPTSLDGARTLGPYYQHLGAVVTSTTYADAFYLLTLLTAGGAVLRCYCAAHTRTEHSTDTKHSDTKHSDTSTTPRAGIMINRTSQW